MFPVRPRRSVITALATLALIAVVLVPATIAHPAARAVIAHPAARAVRAPVPPNLLALPGAEWLTNGGNTYNERYSTLGQITTANVKRLTGVWMTHLHSGIGPQYSLEATPLVQNGVMYVTTGNDDIFALDARTGARRWTYKSGLDQAITSVCCGWDNRGVALGGGLIFSSQLDGSLVALDQSTGKYVWKTQVAPWQAGYTMTAAPLYDNGVVYTGIAGGEFGVRGRLTALDAKTGKLLWHFYTIPGPHDVGGNTWPAHSDAYLHGGATIWNTPAVDPQRGLIYFSTSNAGPDYDGAVRPGDNLFASSIVALHMNGTLAWYFQEVHHDIWDFDAPSPVVLFDKTINGKRRFGIGQISKTGWLYLLDRITGKPLVGIKEKPVPQDAAQRTAPTQPFPVGDATVPQCAQPLRGFQTACIFTPVTSIATVFQPAAEGGTVQSPMAYSPQTGYFYIAGSIWPIAFSRAPQHYVRGITYTGAGATTTPLGSKYGGTLTAINPTTNKIVWQKKTPYVLGEGSGALATAGSLVFVGHPDGTLRAYDAKTGAQLWRWQTGYGADAPAMTYAVDGVQYVAIAAGGNSLTQSANGDAVWVFSLNGPLHGQKLAQATTPLAPPSIVGFRGVIQKTNIVDMVDFGFKVPYFNTPTRLHVTTNRITVPVGTKVTWINLGSQAHTATSVQGGWDTGLVQPGHSASIVMKKVGTFSYTCTPHPWMLGQIIVTKKGTSVGPGRPTHG